MTDYGAYGPRHGGTERQRLQKATVRQRSFSAAAEPRHTTTRRGGRRPRWRSAALGIVAERAGYLRPPGTGVAGGRTVTEPERRRFQLRPRSMENAQPAGGSGGPWPPPVRSRKAACPDRRRQRSGQTAPLPRAVGPPPQATIRTVRPTRTRRFGPGTASGACRSVHPHGQRHQRDGFTSPRREGVPTPRATTAGAMWLSPRLSVPRVNAPVPRPRPSGSAYRPAPRTPALCRDRPTERHA